ncbi:hypothetical protein LXL04_010837 [Taraxacum kok-saghyz]
MVKAWMACFGSFTISIVGGFILLFWEIKYHPSNSQLWMVPVGLIMFLTPVLAWFAVFVSDTITPPTSSDHLFKRQPTAFSQVNSQNPPSTQYFGLRKSGLSFGLMEFRVNNVFFHFLDRFDRVLCGTRPG